MILETADLTALKTLLGITGSKPSDLELVNFISGVSNILIIFGLSPFLTTEETITEEVTVNNSTILVDYPINSIVSITDQSNNSSVDLTKFELIKYSNHITKINLNSCCSCSFECNCNQKPSKYQVIYKSGYTTDWNKYLNLIIKVLYSNYGVKIPTIIGNNDANCNMNIKRKKSHNVELEYISIQEQQEAIDLQKSNIYRLIQPYLLPLSPKFPSSYIL